MTKGSVGIVGWNEDLCSIYERWRAFAPVYFLFQEGLDYPGWSGTHFKDSGREYVAATDEEAVQIFAFIKQNRRNHP